MREVESLIEESKKVIDDDDEADDSSSSDGENHVKMLNAGDKRFQQKQPKRNVDEEEHDNG